jgi:hypothetical protein
MRVYVPPSMRRAIAAQQQRAMKPVTPRVRPATIGVEQYTQKIRGPLQGGYGTATVSGGGAATVTVGPQGTGTIWYPQQASIATTTGAADTSTCALYVGPLSALTLIGSQSYAGGGDSLGLAVPVLYPGSFLVAVWAGGHAGDLAALTIYGQQDVLVVPSPTTGRG